MSSGTAKLRSILTVYCQVGASPLGRRQSASRRAESRRRRRVGLTWKFFSLALWFVLSSAGAVLDVFAIPRFDAWTIDTGLPQNSVSAILQTRDGYLWLATNGGLARYDGVRFTIFDVANSEGIKSNRLTALFEDREGSLWIGTEDSGVSRYRDGRFTAYTTEDGLADNSVEAIEGDERGRLWVLTGEEVSQWTDGHFTALTSQGDPPISRSSAWRSTTKEGITFYDRGGLHRLTDGRLVTYTTKDGMSSLRISSVYRDQRGTLWVGTIDRGLNRFKDGVFTTYTVADGLPSDDVQVTAAYEDSRGNLWVATSGRGLSRLRGGKLTTYTADDGLPSKDIMTIYEDREGSVWVGTSGQGLYRFREEVVTTYSERDGLSANNVYPVYEDRAGRVWVGAWPGLNRYEGGVFTRQLRKDGRPFNLVSALYEDADGGFWIGTYGEEGLTRLKDGKFTEYTTRDGLAADTILAIHQDRAGDFWFGTTAGLSRLRDGRFTTYTKKDGLAGDEVKTICEDRAGALWFGSLGGLTRFKDEAFVAYTEREGLSGRHVRAIHEDADGVIWVGTYDGGLNRLQDGRFTRYTMKDGLFDNGVFRILEDDRGNFWMSSNRGIYRVSRRELNEFAEGRVRSITSISYGKNDGMLNAECNGVSQPAGWRTRDGRMWFPTQEGVAIIDPAAIQTSELAPPVHVEEFIVDDASVAFRDGVRLVPGQERFEIRYTGLSFIKPERVRFRYKLEGLDEEWVNAGAQRSANYSYVPPGSYTFRVMAANSDGVWNTEGARLRIVVHPPFWRTWWFRLMAVAVLGLIAVTAYRLRVAQLKRAKAVQEAFSRQLLDSQERERQRIAGELHDGLGQSLLIIKNRASLALTTTADREATEEQLDEISSSAAHAIEEVREIAYNLRPYQIDRFGLTKTLNAILRQAARSCDIHFTTELAPIDHLFSKQAETNIYRIVQEAVNNIIKHSHATEASLVIQREANEVRLRIEDNGRGFTPVMGPEDESPRGGFGLVGMPERVRILGGVYTINSAVGRGTAIDIKLPVPKDNHEK